MKVAKTWILPFICFLLGANLVLHSMISFIHRDEIEFIHTVWLISKGKIIYQDFFQHHHFLAYYMFLPFLKIFGESVKTIYLFRFIFLIFSVGISAITYGLAKNVFNKTVGLWSIIFLFVSPTFLMDGIKIRTDTIMVFFCMLSVLLLFKYFEKNRRLYFYTSILSLAFSFLILQKSVFFIFVFHLLFLFQISSKSPFQILKDMALSVLTLSFVSFAGYFLFIKIGFSDFINLNWVVNYYWDNHNSVLGKFLQVLLINLFVSVFALTFFLIPKEKNVKARPFVFMTLGLVGSVFLYKNLAIRYFLNLFPLLVIFAAWAYVAVSNKLRLVPKIILAMVSFLPFLVFGWKKMDADASLAKVKLIEWVQKSTKPEDLVYDGYNAFNLYRYDADYFWFSTSPQTGGLSAYQKTKPYDYDLAKIIREKKPKVVYDIFVTPAAFFELAREGYKYVSLNEIDIIPQSEWDEKFFGLFLRQ